jgi:hypothetical protein
MENSITQLGSRPATGRPVDVIISPSLGSLIPGARSRRLTGSL